MNAPETPQNLDAEKATIGSCLLNRDAITQIAARLTPQAFYLERHAQIYDVIRSLYERRIPPDMRTVLGELRKRNQVDAIGGAAYLSELVDYPATSYHVEHYAKLVIDCAFQRAAIAAGSKIAALGYDNRLTTDELRERVLQVIGDAVARPDRAGFVSLGDMMSELADQFNKDQTQALPTGLHDLDRLIYGVRRGRLITIAGRPSHGKTALALTIALNVVERGVSALVFSMEMDGTEIAQRVLSMQSGIDGEVIQQLQLDEGELRTATETMLRIGPWPMFVHAETVSLSDIRSLTLQHIAEQGPVALVVVDYVGLVKASGKRGQTRGQEVGEISRGLKALAMEARCDVLMLSQMNREIEKRPGEVPIPSLADLRETGDLEQDSNIVIFVVNPELFDPDTDQKGVGILHVAKHRGGKRGRVILRFDAACTRFQNLTHFREVEGYE